MKLALAIGFGLRIFGVRAYNKASVKYRFELGYCNECVFYLITEDIGNDYKPYE